MALPSGTVAVALPQALSVAGSVAGEPEVVKVAELQSEVVNDGEGAKEGVTGAVGEWEGGAEPAAQLEAEGEGEGERAALPLAVAQRVPAGLAPTAGASVAEVQADCKELGRALAEAKSEARAEAVGGGEVASGLGVGSGEGERGAEGELESCGEAEGGVEGESGRASLGVPLPVALAQRVVAP